MLDPVAPDGTGENSLERGRPQVGRELTQRPTDRRVASPEARAVTRGIHPHARREAKMPERSRAQRDLRVEINTLGQARLQAGLSACHTSGGRIKAEIEGRAPYLLVHSGK